MNFVNIQWIEEEKKNLNETVSHITEHVSSSLILRLLTIFARQENWFILTSTQRTGARTDSDAFIDFNKS